MHLCWWMHRVLVAALIAFWALSSVAHAEDSSEACEQFVRRILIIRESDPEKLCELAERRM